MASAANTGHPNPLASSPTTTEHSQHAHFFGGPETVEPEKLPVDEKTSPNSTSAPTFIGMPDGRRNSQGNALPSPIIDWRPDIKRKQSFKREDLKRDVYGREMKVEEDECAQGTGFTEGGAGTRNL